MKSLNIILANAPINNGNRGCMALSISVMSLIDSIMKEANVPYIFFLPDSGFKECEKRNYQVGKTVILSYQDCIYPYTTSFGNTLKHIAIMLSRGTWQYRHLIKQADYILDIGQGDSFSDIYGESRFQRIDLIHKIARKYNKPYCLLPQTIGPFESEKIERQAQRSIHEAELCMARDKQSYDYVVKNIPAQKNIKEYVDVAFFMPYEIIPQDKQYTHVGLNVSSLIWHGGYTQDNQFGLKCDYQKTIRSIIDYFLQQPNTKVHLVPHVVGSERHVENDYEISYDLWREYANNNLIIAPFALGPVEIKSYIAGLDFFVGARMHATIGAFSSLVPVVPMAYSRKFNGLFLDTLNYPYICDMKTQTADDIMEVIKNAFTERAKLKNIVTDRMNGVVAVRKKELINDLKKFFKIK